MIPNILGSIILFDHQPTRFWTLLTWLQGRQAASKDIQRLHGVCALCSLCEVCICWYVKANLILLDTGIPDTAAMLWTKTYKQHGLHSRQVRIGTPAASKESSTAQGCCASTMNQLDLQSISAAWHTTTTNPIKATACRRLPGHWSRHRPSHRDFYCYVPMGDDHLCRSIYPIISLVCCQHVSGLNMLKYIPTMGLCCLWFWFKPAISTAHFVRIWEDFRIHHGLEPREQGT